MNTLIKVLKNTQFLRYFNSDWARLMALALVLGAAILVAKSLTTWNVLIAGVLAIMVVVIKGIFEVAKHRISADADVEKMRHAYREVEKANKNQDKLI